MSLRVNTNIAAMNAYRNLTVTEGSMGKSLEKLSSGFRINRAADDAAGLVNSESLRAQIGGLHEVPGDGLSLAVGVGGKPDRFRALCRLLDTRDHLLLVRRDDVSRLEALVYIDAELALGKVADVAD